MCIFTILFFQFFHVVFWIEIAIDWIQLNIHPLQTSVYLINLGLIKDLCGDEYEFLIQIWGENQVLPNSPAHPQTSPHTPIIIYKYIYIYKCMYIHIIYMHTHIYYVHIYTHLLYIYIYIWGYAMAYKSDFVGINHFFMLVNWWFTSC